MARNTLVIEGATPDDVWAVLADGWNYDRWVVGCHRIRAVDDAFPTPRSALHHAVGFRFATIKDFTKILEAEPASFLALHARAWPLGTARVEFRVEAGTPGTRVTMTEEGTRGPMGAVPDALFDLLVIGRNQLTLIRLARLVRRHRRTGLQATRGG